jgi:hypothetical protein
VKKKETGEWFRGFDSLSFSCSNVSEQK